MNLINIHFKKKLYFIYLLATFQIVKDSFNFLNWIIYSIEKFTYTLKIRCVSLSYV